MISIKSLLSLLMLFVMLILVGEQAFAGAGGGYSINTRPPSFGNSYGKEEKEEEKKADQEGGYTYFMSPLGKGSYHISTPSVSRKNIALQVICKEGYFAERMVYCIRGIIDKAVAIFLDKFEVMLNSYILSLIILAVTLFGGQILMGTVERPGQDAFLLLLKIGAVLLFTNGLGNFLPFIFPVMESLASYAMSYIGEGGQSPFLASCSDGDTYYDVSIWRRVDCIIQRLFTGNDAADGAGYPIGVLWVLAVCVFWTTFLGFFVFLVMLSTFIMIFLLVLRCVYVFLAAYAFLALLIIISPLIIPLTLFKSTTNYFNKWWRQFLSMIITPMLLFAYMSFVFALIDSLFFKDEPYSLARILGVNWENPEVKKGMDEDTVEEKMEEYAEQYSFKEEDEQYQGYKKFLEQNVKYLSIGNVLLEEEQFISIQINAAKNVTKGLTEDIPVVGRAISKGAEVVDAVAEWGLNKLSSALIPFQVTRIKPEGRTRWSFMMDLLKFFLVVFTLLPLLNKFTSEIPRLIQALSSSIRVAPGSVMPVEKQVIGTIGAAKGATTGIIRGAITGFVTGGKKGAIVGAVQGGVSGAASGYKKATGDRGGNDAGGNENKDNIHMSKGEGVDRKILHGESGGRFGGKSKGIAKDIAITAATRGKGGKGGG